MISMSFMASEKPLMASGSIPPGFNFACRCTTTLASTIAVISSNIRAFSIVNFAVHFVVAMRDKKILILITILYHRIRLAEIHWSAFCIKGWQQNNPCLFGGCSRLSTKRRYIHESQGKPQAQTNGNAGCGPGKRIHMGCRFFTTSHPGCAFSYPGGGSPLCHGARERCRPRQYKHHGPGGDLTARFNFRDPIDPVVSGNRIDKNGAVALPHFLHITCR